MTREHLIQILKHFVGLTIYLQLAVQFRYYCVKLNDLCQKYGFGHKKFLKSLVASKIEKSSSKPNKEHDAQIAAQIRKDAEKEFKEITAKVRYENEKITKM